MPVPHAVGELRKRPEGAFHRPNRLGRRATGVPGPVEDHALCPAGNEGRVCVLDILPPADSRKGYDSANEDHSAFFISRGALIAFAADDSSFPNILAHRSGLVECIGERDFDRPESRQLLYEGFVKHGSVGRETEQVRGKLPADQPENFEKLRMQEDLPLGNSAGKAVAEAYGPSIVLSHQRKLQLDVLDVPEKPRGNRKRIQVV